MTSSAPFRTCTALRTSLAGPSRLPLLTRAPSRKASSQSSSTPAEPAPTFMERLATFSDPNTYILNQTARRTALLTSKPSQNALATKLLGPPATPSIYDSFDKSETGKALRAPTARAPYVEHKYSTGIIKSSVWKLNLLAKLVAGMQVDKAIAQLELSDKKYAGKFKSMLVTARCHAEKKGLPRERLVLDECWVNKGRMTKSLDIKGRGRHGLKNHFTAKIHVILRPGPTPEEAKIADYQKKMQVRLRTGAGMVRENPKIVHLESMGGRANYAW